MKTEAAFTAATLFALAGKGRLLVVTASDGRAAALSDALPDLLSGALSGGATVPVAYLPAWDCLPFDRVDPSRSVTGRRMAASAAMAETGKLIVVASAEAIAQRLPPPVAGNPRLETGAPFDGAVLRSDLERLGYVVGPEAEQPGEVAIGTGVVDIVPPDGIPVRIRHADGIVTEIDGVDPASHRSRRVLSRFDIAPASELVFDAPHERPPGSDHRLPELSGPLQTVFEALRPATIVLARDVRDALAAHLQLIEDSRASRIAMARAKGGPMPPAGLYLDRTELDAALAGAIEADLPDAAPVAPKTPDWTTPALRIGDAVVDLDRGVAVLDGIETVQDGTADVLALRFAGGRRELVPAEEIGRIWRFGAAENAPLDAIDGKTWPPKVLRAEKALAATAKTLIEQVAARDATVAPAFEAPARDLAKFEAGFPFPPTPDQSAAIAAVTADLARKKPMDRLLVGDVGFGKTEAALRAAAIVALAGGQVAVLAPTTVLVRQHLSVFRRRFARLGIEVSGLSRLTGPAEARRVRDGLAGGSVRIVVGTQALGAKGVEFRNLALVVIDEEQRFGAQAKTALARLRDGCHVLTLSATPIPRTLGAALAGLTELSTLHTPPVARRPVRTSVEPFDTGVLVAALRREHARGGQSFVVCPRIEDLGETAELIERLAPELTTVQLHGQLKPDALDAAIVSFAEGHGDVLVSTDIIEAGLDIPRANTIAVCRADLFGLAQLHQMRGRVGRGVRRGMAWLFTDEQAPPTGQAAARLATLAAHDGLGDGFLVAAGDLDQRGLGDLGGAAQSGHAQALGVELTSHLLRRALAAARGETPAPDWVPMVKLGLAAAIPPDWLPDANARVALHATLVRNCDTAALAEELEDRHGTLPETVRTLLAVADLRAECVRQNIEKLDAGPLGAAATDRDGHRTVVKQPSHTLAGRLAVARAVLEAIASKPARRAA